jgi:aspartate/methionine/tyrosine aminotransferase
MGGEPRLVSLDPVPGGGWRLDPERLFAACDDRTRGIFVNSPSNPTGWVMTRAETEALLSFTRRHGIWLIADEVYARIVYDRDVAPSVIDVAEPEDRVIVVNSFSKAWAMTGWRLGWMVIPPDLPQMLAKLVQYNTSGSPTFLQHAAIAAIGEGESFIAEMRRQYRAARDRVVEHFERVGRVRLSAPEGAFYAFFQVEGMTDSVGFAKELLRRTKVGLAPGAAFGLGGEGHLRLCFAASPDRLDPALDRLAEALA